MTLNCNGKLIDLSTPKVMGILNVTPDSFYDGGKFTNDKSLLSQVEKLTGRKGLAFIDIGADSFYALALILFLKKRRSTD